MRSVVSQNKQRKLRLFEKFDRFCGETEKILLRLTVTIGTVKLVVDVITQYLLR